MKHGISPTTSKRRPMRLAWTSDRLGTYRAVDNQHQRIQRMADRSKAVGKQIRRDARQRGQPHGG